MHLYYNQSNANYDVELRNQYRETYDFDNRVLLPSARGRVTNMFRQLSPEVFRNYKETLLANIRRISSTNAAFFKIGEVKTISDVINKVSSNIYNPEVWGAVRNAIFEANHTNWDVQRIWAMHPTINPSPIAQSKLPDVINGGIVKSWLMAINETPDKKVKFAKPVSMNNEANEVNHWQNIRNVKNRSSSKRSITPSSHHNYITQKSLSGSKIGDTETVGGVALPAVGRVSSKTPTSRTTKKNKYDYSSLIPLQSTGEITSSKLKDQSTTTRTNALRQAGVNNQTDTTISESNARQKLRTPSSPKTKSKPTRNNIVANSLRPIGDSSASYNDFSNSENETDTTKMRRQLGVSAVPSTFESIASKTSYVSVGTATKPTPKSQAKKTTKLQMVSATGASIPSIDKPQLKMEKPIELHSEAMRFKGGLEISDNNYFQSIAKRHLTQTGVVELKSEKPKTHALTIQSMQDSDVPPAKKTTKLQMQVSTESEVMPPQPTNIYKHEQLVAVPPQQKRKLVIDQTAAPDQPYVNQRRGKLEIGNFNQFTKRKLRQTNYGVNIGGVYPSVSTDNWFLSLSNRGLQK